MSRIVCRFSCGAASAVATKLILQTYPREQVTILNAFIVEEHEDNRRFLADCEKWFNHPITVVQDEKYGASVVEVFKRRRILRSQYGFAPCSAALKRDVLDSYCLPNDTFVFGFTAEESNRMDRFIDANNGRKVICPLIDRGLTKANCLAIMERAYIELPLMYRMGYNNANCVGCIKGGDRDIGIRFV